MGKIQCSGVKMGFVCLKNYLVNSGFNALQIEM